MSDAPLLITTDAGLYCPAGDFHIDPSRAVDRSLITHAHSDHARPGSRQYLTCAPGVDVLLARVGGSASIRGLDYGESLSCGDVRISFHPAGHVLGSCQVRVEHRGEVSVVSGDYKTQPDPTCDPIEIVPCHTFITESTFGLPIYRWRPPEEVFAEIDDWWRANQAADRAGVVFAYSLGKAQRILAGVDASIGPIFVHEAINDFLPCYRHAGVEFPPVHSAADDGEGTRRRGLILAPQAAEGSAWLRAFGDCAVAVASGWARVRGAQRRMAVDRGFVLSDHADWPGLLETIRATGATRIGVTHGSTAALSRYLREQGYDSWELEAVFSGESGGVNKASSGSNFPTQA